MKNYTDLKQGRQLAKFLPLESADMYWWYNGQRFYVETKEHNDFQKSDIPCWSLSALLDILPYEICDDGGNSSYLQINKENNVYQLVYEDPYKDSESIETDRYEHFVDACYEMVIKLHEQKLL